MTRTVVRAWFLLVLAGVIAVAWASRGHWELAALEAGLVEAGAAAPLLFVASYALATVLFLPGSVLTLAGGALFGPLWGTLYSLIGATIGAALAFLLARYLVSDWVRTRLDAGTQGQAARLVKGVEAEGWRFVAFTRLVPLFPFNLLNYALGLTRIPLLDYVLASLIFMTPGALAYTYLGYTGREAAAGSEGLIRHGLIALALLAVVAFLPRLIARLRQPSMLDIEALKARADTGDGLILDVRSANEYAGESGHIAGALNLPLEELEPRIAELGADPARPIAVVCLTDRRSSKAAALLARHGYTNVSVARGSMRAWLANGWPIENHSNSTGKDAEA